METYKSGPVEMIPCAHCNQTGTCSNAEDQNSCLVCIEKNKIKGIKTTKGLACGICGGAGFVEPKTSRLHNRIVPVLAMLIVYFALILVFVHARKEHFSEILAFSGTLIGSITGFYFGGKKRS